MKPAAVLSLLAFVLIGCASGAGRKATTPALPPPPPAPPPSLPKPTAFFDTGTGPTTPALKALQGRVPLVHLKQKNLRRTNDPGYELAIFDDGTLMYEGSRCVRLGGLVLRRLDGNELQAVQELLTSSCVPRPTTSSDEVCPERGGLSITCSGAASMISSTDRCIGPTGPGAELQSFGEAILERTGVGAWIGSPTERLACDALSGDMANGEIARTLSAKSAPFAAAAPGADSP
jgi:hypothetical protein